MIEHTQPAADNKQLMIKQWFDNTYRNKGERYLRPVKAYDIFLAQLQVKQQHKLLDVACGLGRLLEAARPYGCDCYGVDLSDIAITKARNKLPSAHLRVANAEELPFEDAYFDLVTCLGSLERMIDLDKVLQELLRIGHQNTQYCFLVRNSNTFIWQLLKEKMRMRNKAGNQNAMSLQQWTRRFESAGFNIKAIHPDQYPLQKRRKWLSFGIAKIDYKQLILPNKNLERANEFIFIMSKI